MTDYEYKSGNSGMFRHSGGGAGARNPFPWIGHPRERESTYPIQPRFALADAAWADDLAAFQALVTADQFDRAMSFVRDGGFKIATTDVPDDPEGTRTAFVARVRAQWPSTQRDCLAGSGW